MKAIIPVAGAGTQLRPLTYTQPKALIPVAGKPILSFIIDQLIDEGVEEFIFIIGYLGEKIETYVVNAYPDIENVFVVQKERKGLGHAIWTARNHLSANDDVVIFLGDTIVDIDLKKFLNHDVSCLGVRKVSDPQNFGVVEMGENMSVSRVIEKPAIPKSNLAMVGLYYIKSVGLLINALEENIQNDIKTHGEFQLTDGLMKLIRNKVTFNIQEVNNWFDCGKWDILLETNAVLLGKGDFPGKPNGHFPDAIIIPPVSIGEDSIIEHSIIGPNVTIGSNTKIRSSIINDSIIGNYSNLIAVSLSHSIIGNDASIKGYSQSLNMGDNTEMDLS